MNFRNENDHKYNLSFNLLHEINTNECTYKILSSKVEVKLKKKEGVRWDSLERATSADNNVQEGIISLSLIKFSCKFKIDYRNLQIH